MNSGIIRKMKRDQPLQAVHPIRIKHGYTLWCALIGFLLLGAWGCVLPLSRSFNNADGIRVRFQYTDPQANKVCVSGNFNNWSKDAHCLARTGGDWVIEITLPPGRYQYLFVVDDKFWREDPEALLREKNGFDGENSVLIVEQ